MKRHVAIAALLMAIGLAAPAHAADPSGIWLVQDGDAHVRIAKCGDGFCGTLVWLEHPNDPTTGRPLTDVRNPDPSKRGKPLLGTMIAINFLPLMDPPNTWAGKFYNADDGMQYEGSIRPNGADELLVKGCLGTACDTQKWTKVRR